MLFSRAEEGRFPENKELKNLVRDAIDPGRDLGHSEDTTGPTSRNSGTTAFDRLVSGVAEVVATNKQHAALARLVRCSSTASQRLQPHSFRRQIYRMCLGVHPQRRRLVTYHQMAHLLTC